MKKSIILGTVALAAASLTSCDDFLNDNRFPLSQQTANTEFWSSATNVQGQINYFYESFLGYSNGSSTGEFYFRTLSDDQCCPSGNASITPWTNINVPASSTNWSAPYVEIRRANLIIEGVTAGSLSGTEEANFLGIARLNRAYQYYLLVRAYGDVPLIDQALDPSIAEDVEALFGPRTAREKVMDSALEDLDYAIANISVQSGKQVFSKDLAMAIKAEICLYEASFSKYHKNDTERANKYFNEVVKAATPLLASYPIGDNYQATYTSFNSAALANSEIIFLKEYVKDVFMHCTVDYTSSSTPVSGLTKDAFDAYLFKDGKPLALTSCNKNDAGTMLPKMENGQAVKDKDGNIVWDALSIREVLEQRDGRLSQTVDTAVYFTGLTYTRPNSMPMTSLTGYGIKKFVNPEMDYEYSTTIWNYTCAPLYWGAQVALAYAEAKAELGTLTDADLNLTLNKLYARAGLPDQTVASLSSMNDPANNMGVSSLLWEVRRCRRCELILDKGIRYWDLVRWHKLDLLDNTKYPNIGLGANVSNSAVAVSKVGDYMNAANGTTRVFSEREYYYPIPSGQLSLNTALKQNPGWE